MFASSIASGDIARKGTPFEFMPVELVRTIVEAAAEDYQTCTTLALVSKTINNWVTPFLYHTLLPNNSDHIRTLHRGIGTGMDRAIYVRNLFLPLVDSHASEMTNDILRRCTRVQRVVLAGRPLAAKSYNWPQPDEVTIFGLALQWLCHPVVENVSHLCLADVSYYVEPEAFQSFKRLTHLSLKMDRHNIDRFVTSAKTILTSMPSLKVLLIQSHTSADYFIGHHWEELAAIDDARLFAVPLLCSSVFVEFLALDAGIWDNLELFKEWRGRVKV